MNWTAEALTLGFDTALPLDPSLLRAEPFVREMCASDKCRAYGRNWTCPPACGTLSECQERLNRYCRGILLQTVGHLQKDIDAKGYRETETRHMEHFRTLCTMVRREHPYALCLGSGGCRICKVCAYPDPCRYPDQAIYSMESHGLFVTKVCRDCGAPYHHGEKTITFTACILY